MAQPLLKDLEEIEPAIASVDDAISSIDTTLQPLFKSATADGISDVRIQKFNTNISNILHDSRCRLSRLVFL